MSAPQQTDIRRWFQTQATSLAPEANLSGAEAAKYAANCIAFFADESVDWSNESLLEPALRTIAANLGEVIFNGTATALEVAVVLSASAGLTRVFGTATEDNTALFGFWDSVLTHLHEEGLWVEHPLLREAFFSALLGQLSSHNRYCQLSALHGLNHLRHPRTQLAVDWFLSTAGDQELRDYAATARRFDAM